MMSLDKTRFIDLITKFENEVAISKGKWLKTVSEAFHAASEFKVVRRDNNSSSPATTTVFAMEAYSRPPKSITKTDAKKPAGAKSGNGARAGAKNAKGSGGKPTPENTPMVISGG